MTLLALFCGPPAHPACCIDLGLPSAELRLPEVRLSQPVSRCAFHEYGRPTQCESRLPKACLVPHGPVVVAGDVIGAMWNRIDGIISFYKNGVALGAAFHGVRHEKLYPTVGLRTTGEEVSSPTAPPPLPILPTRCCASYCERVLNELQGQARSSVMNRSKIQSSRLKTSCTL